MRYERGIQPIQITAFDGVCKQERSRAQTTRRLLAGLDHLKVAFDKLSIVGRDAFFLHHVFDNLVVRTKHPFVPTVGKAS
jgi:hypothetical protein